MAWYPLEPGWRVPARFEPATDGESVAIVNQLGDVAETPAAGRLRFRLHGAGHALLATWKGEDLFVNLRDAGSGPENYGAGRFLDVSAPDPSTPDETWLDLHRLYHSPFATCPLPPLENRLPFVVRAGGADGVAPTPRSGHGGAGLLYPRASCVHASSAASASAASTRNGVPCRNASTRCCACSSYGSSVGIGTSRSAPSAPVSTSRPDAP